MYDDGWITLADKESIYDFDRENNPIYIDRDLTTYVAHEDLVARRDATIHNMAESTGTFTIGAAGTYATVTLFEADIATPLTGNLTGEHLNEETTIATHVIFDTQTATYLLKLTAQSGAEHNGENYGNGARITLTANDSIGVDETTDGHLDDFEISKLAIDATGANNIGVSFTDGGNSGLLLANRLVIVGDNDSDYGVRFYSTCTNGRLTNSVIYAFGNAATEGGVFVTSVGAGDTIEIYNNTVCKCYDNIFSGTRQSGLS
jgi:hypothetical protein